VLPRRRGLERIPCLTPPHDTGASYDSPAMGFLPSPQAPSLRAVKSLLRKTDMAKGLSHACTKPKRLYPPSFRVDGRGGYSSNISSAILIPSEKAAAACRDAAIRLHGDFARTEQHLPLVVIRGEGF